MRKETAEWLAPLYEAMDKADISSAELDALLRSATMPAREADTAYFDWLAQLQTPRRAGQEATDWVRFGQLLKARLGLEDYPPVPDFPENRPPT
jgi:hypothetical protein